MTIRVTLINPSDRRFYQAQWDDPLTGRTKTKSTKTTNRREAERFAGTLEKSLNEGTYKPKTRTTWKELEARYLAEVSNTKAARTKKKTEAMFNAIPGITEKTPIHAIGDVNYISEHSAKLLDEGRSPFTVHGHLAELKKVLRWANRKKLIHEVPDIDMPTVVDGMKGRPLKDDEFRRMIEAIPAAKMDRVYRTKGQHRLVSTTAIPPQFVPGWQHYLEGLWWSSLRLEETELLHWEDDRGIMVDLSGRYPMFRIQAKAQKNRKFQLLPMSWEFAEFLERTPRSKRTGFVFHPLTYPPGKQVGEWRPRPQHIGRIVTAIGKAAGILVNETKYASAQDFRRSFGFRWAKRVLPSVLKELMRHSDIQTTMQFYVGILADDAAEIVWNTRPAAGNSPGNKTVIDLLSIIENLRKQLENQYTSVQPTRIESNDR